VNEILAIVLEGSKHLSKNSDPSAASATVIVALSRAGQVERRAFVLRGLALRSTSSPHAIWHECIPQHLAAKLGWRHNRPCEVRYSSLEILNRPKKLWFSEIKEMHPDWPKPSFPSLVSAQSQPPTRVLKDGDPTAAAVLTGVRTPSAPLAKGTGVWISRLHRVPSNLGFWTWPGTNADAECEPTQLELEGKGKHECLINTLFIQNVLWEPHCCCSVLVLYQHRQRRSCCRFRPGVKPTFPYQ